MKRIDGDEMAATRLRALDELLDEAMGHLAGPRDHADRCIEAAAALSAARHTLAGAVCALEELTEIPFGAIAIDPAFGKAP